MSTQEARGASAMDSLWDATDVAKYVGASRSWVYLRAQRGEIPHIRKYGLLRFDPDVIRSWAKDDTPTAKILALKKKRDD